MPGELQNKFRQAMSVVCSPVSIVTGLDENGPHGTTVSAFASLSMNPPMLLLALDKRSELLALLRGTRRFGLNVLASTQSPIARTFAGKTTVSRFKGISWTADNGVPRLPDATAFIACAVTKVVDGGDHVALFGTALAADTAEAPPLTYHARGFGTHRPLTDLRAP